MFIVQYLSSMKDEFKHYRPTSRPVIAEALFIYTSLREPIVDDIYVVKNQLGLKRNDSCAC